MLLHAWLDLPQWWLAAALVGALWVDRRWGEPPAPWHPVVWMGHYLGAAGRRVHAASDAASFVRGALAWWGGAVLCTGVALGLLGFLAWLAGQGAAGSVVAAVLLALALKPLLAWTMLRSEVLAVEQALSPQWGGDLQRGRERLAWLVSRDVQQLDSAGVRESAIESLAENLNDSVVAPLCWFALLGLPGAALFRFANTADAMWGYRGSYRGVRWEWAGKWAARADDLLCWWPARLTAVLLLLFVQRLPLRWAALRQEAARTPSPNSGWPMAAMALALGVRLGKPGVYVLHPEGRSPQTEDTLRAIALASRAVAATAALLLLGLGAAHWATWGGTYPGAAA